MGRCLRCRTRFRCRMRRRCGRMLAFLVHGGFLWELYRHTARHRLGRHEVRRLWRRELCAERYTRLCCWRFRGCCRVVPFWDVDFDVVGEDFWDCLEVGLEVGVDADLEYARCAYIPK